MDLKIGQPPSSSKSKPGNQCTLLSSWGSHQIPGWVNLIDICYSNLWYTRSKPTCSRRKYQDWSKIVIIIQGYSRLIQVNVKFLLNRGSRRQNPHLLWAWWGPSWSLASGPFPNPTLTHTHSGGSTLTHSPDIPVVKSEEISMCDHFQVGYRTLLLSILDTCPTTRLRLGLGSKFHMNRQIYRRGSHGTPNSSRSRFSPCSPLVHES